MLQFSIASLSLVRISRVCAALSLAMEASLRALSLAVKASLKVSHAGKLVMTQKVLADRVRVTQGRSARAAIAL